MIHRAQVMCVLHLLHLSSSSPHQLTLSLLVATETSDTEITTTEIIKRRDVGPYGIRSEYCIRKIICPLGVPETPKGEPRFLVLTLQNCHL